MCIRDRSVGASIINVDSTVGFGTTGTVISGANSSIDYTSKSINQFFGCSGIGVGIGTADNIRDNETIFGYENGDLSKRIDLRITGVLSELVPITDISLINEGENFFVKNIGEKIENDSKNYKQIFANSWIYNTSSRFQVDIPIGSSTFTLKTSIDKSSLKVGDRFDILKRNEQVIAGSGTVASVNTGLNQITVSNIAGFTQDANQLYDIRRKVEKASSSGVTIAQGNDSIIADTLSVYTDGNTDGYVASNSLPSYDITTNIIEETLTGGTAAGLDGFNSLNDRYSFINFNIGRNIKFIQGDAVTYLPEGDGLIGLDTGRTYFVDPVIPEPGQDITKIRIFNSTAQIGSASTVQVGPTTSTTDIHRFVLQRHSSRELEADNILRKIPLSQNLFVSSNQDIPTNDIGILINGVQIRSPISDNQIYYCLLYTSPSPRDRQKSRMPSYA